jgi:DNA-binding FadR family transcriptional regulator
MTDRAIIHGGSNHQGLSEVVYTHILAGILDGTYSQGSRLPAEVKLAAWLGVSRPVVRVALARLRDDGRILSKQGSGSYVMSQPSVTASTFPSPSSISDIELSFELRIAMEATAAYQAAQRRTDADLHHMKAALQALELAAKHNPLSIDEDYNFHFAVCQAAQNRFYIETMKFLRESVVISMNVARNLSAHHFIGYQSIVRHEHEAIIETIACGNAELARTAMRRHLENARRRLFQGCDFHRSKTERKAAAGV